MDRLLNNKQIGFEVIEDSKKVFDFNNGYLNFLNNVKTERECIKYIEKQLKEKGFQKLEKIKALKENDKVYFINRDKALYAAVIGKNKLEKGLNIIGAHTDSPRLDLKPNPLYEELDLALFKTHYYGGIKKYQWTAIPLAIHGVIIKKDGTKIDISIGEKDKDPVFTITDLLPHLATKQNKKTLEEGISGEELNLLIGSMPNKNKKEEKIKLNILNILNKKYGISEKDLISSEIEIVPAFKAKNIGLDESMIGAYGQDDKASVYTLLQAITKINNLTTTAVMLLSDKEEIGSMGNTGMESQSFEVFIAELLNKTNQNNYNVLEKVLNNSKMLSADVTSASDPTFSSVDDLLNAAYLGKGIALAKYTGTGGKSGANDASAEYVAYIRSILENNNLLYQVTDMGKVDEGGGGTIAYILANKGMDVIDCGVPILSMHSPYEITSKYDIYNSYQFFKAFFNK